MFQAIAIEKAGEKVGETASADEHRKLRQATTTAEIFTAQADAGPYTLAFRAYVWGMPLVDWAKIRLFQTRPDEPFSTRPAHNAGAAINRFGKGRELYGPQSTDGVGPSNDTLYSIGSFDTQDGPFVIETPDFGDRYYTFTVYMGDTVSRQSPGQRTHGGRLPPMFLYGPDYSGPVPEGMLAIPADTRYVLIAGRFLVDGSPADLTKVHQLQDQLRVRNLKAYSAGLNEAPPVSEQRLIGAGQFDDDPPLHFMAQLGDILRDWHVRDNEAALVASFSEIGLSVTKGFDTDSLSESNLAQIRQGVNDAMTLVAERSRQLGTQQNGWTTSYVGANFGNDYLLRAAVAKDQIGVSIAREAIYPIGREDSEGRLLDGHHRYRIVMRRVDLPPVDAFWSITLYDDQGKMISNPIDRYSIGDRTAQLVANDAGDIAIALQHDQPTDSGLNWLPAPCAPFYLMMRLYNPREEILQGRWQPPAIVRETGDGGVDAQCDK